MNGFLVRWGLVGLGAFTLIGGLNSLAGSSGVAEEAQPVSLDEAGMLARSGTVEFVRIAGTPDLTRAAFGTGINEPAYTRRNVTDAATLGVSAGVDDYRDLIGSPVRVDAALAPGVVVIQEVWVESGEGVHEGDLQSERIIATSAHAPGEVFFISPPLQNEDNPAYQSWLARGWYTGTASRMRDLRENLPSLGKAPGEILDHFSMAGVPTRGDAVAILTDATDAAPRLDARCYVPFVGGDNSVLIRTTAGALGSLPERVEGVIERERGALFGVLGSIVGPVPPTIGVVNTTITGAEFNARRSAQANAGIFGGGAMLLIGGGWVLAVRKAKQRKRLKLEQDLEVLAAIEAEQLNRAA